MVAREPGTQRRRPSNTNALVALAETWRSWLSGAVRSSRLLETRAADRGGRPAWFERGWVPVLGIVCFAVGAAGAVLIAPAGHARTIAAVTVVEGAVWAGARGLLMRVAGRGPSARGRTLLRAWAFGLVPFAVAVIPALRAAAWVASAAVTWFGLVRGGDRPHNAARTVGIAWGTQAAVVVISRLASAGVVALLAIRG